MNKLWKQITPSDFSWEQEALEFLRERLPDHEPYRAWANFEFIAQDGSINEIDLLVLTPKGLFLVEIKSHPGEIGGDAGTWVWNNEGRRKAFDNPRLLADRKAKKLASLLRSQRSGRNGAIPFISTLVFLSAENVTNKLQGPARQNVCTRKNVLDELIKFDEFWKHKKLDRPTSKSVSRSLEEAGVKESMRSRRVGLYELTELLDEADHFQDWLAIHSETGIQRRIRIYLTYGKSVKEADTLQKAAKLEFRVLEGIEYPGILRAREYQQHDQGPALVFEHDNSAVRLDHFVTGLGETTQLDILDTLNLLRQIAETVRFAHGQRLFHRALSPQSVYVLTKDDGSFSIKVGNWSTADRSFEAETRHLTVLSHLSCLVQEEAGPYMALEGHSSTDVDSVYLDIFSLGAIAYLLFTGKSPAQDDLELQDKLSRGTGLQITDELNGAGQELQDLIQYATHPDVGSRIGSVDEFMDYIHLVEDEITRPDNQRQSDPTEAKSGDLFEGGILIKKRLGRGASSVAFVVEHEGQERVLKLAVNADYNKRMRIEGETLNKLRHQAIVAHYDTQEFVGHTGLVIDYANEGTLARRLREQGAIQLELLERFGDDLLSAICHLEEKGISHRDIKPENIGLMKQGRQLHLVLFDFSLSSVPADNFTAGTVAYMDPFIRDPGRRRWDDYAERFSAALTLYEMATATLPAWTSSEGMPPLIEGALEIDSAIFDPGMREVMVGFFNKALAREVKQRFDNADEMRSGWREIFLQARQETQHPEQPQERAACAIDEAQLDTQIGLLMLTPQALDTLSRLNINTVHELIQLPRNELVRMTGVGTQTRRELSELVAKLQQRLGVEPKVAPKVEGLSFSIDQLFASVFPKSNDAERAAFLNEYLGRLDSDAPKGSHTAHWPTLVNLAAEIGMDNEQCRDIQTRVINQWGKNKSITELRNDIAEQLGGNGGLMTAVELAEAILLRRGSAQSSPTRERYAQAVLRAAIETEFSRQQSRWTLRRSGKRILIADNTQDRGEELADYAEALGQLADECAEQQPLLSPVRALERIRAVTAPESFAGLSNHRLLRLAVAASQGAALSSRAEFYPIGMSAERSTELAQGALLGTSILTVAEVIARIQGRYPEAQPIPGRPQLDALMQKLDLGFQWDGSVEVGGKRGAYCLPQAGVSSYATKAQTTYYHTEHEEGDIAGAREIDQFNMAVQNTIESSRFLALSVRPRHWNRAKARLQSAFDFTLISFDELLLRHLHDLCEGMQKPPKWEVVLKADAADVSSVDWSRLQSLVRKVMPAMAEEIIHSDRPVLLTEPGLIARYQMVDNWLGDLRQRLMNTQNTQALVLLVANDVTTSSAIIDGVSVPSGAGSKEFARIPTAWLMQPDTGANQAQNEDNPDSMEGISNS